MHIALATCAEVPDWEVDDAPLHAALAARGATVHRPVWDDPTVDWAHFDACLIRTTWDYVPKIEAFLAWAERAGRATRLWHDAAVVRWNTHKGYLRDLESRGIAITPTAWLAPGTAPDLGALCAQNGFERAFVKPAVGATSSGTLRFAAQGAELESAQRHVATLLRRGEALLQPYVATVESAGELSVIVLDGAITHAVRKRPVPGDYRVQDDFGASDERETPSAAVAGLALEVVAAAAECLDRRADALLYARVDFLDGPDGELWLNELELIEPSLFFRHGPGAAATLADALLARTPPP